MKKYILFDNDGVLVETEPLYFKASQRALKEYFDLEFHMSEYMDLMTHGGAVWYKALKLGASEEEVTKARNKRNLYYQEYILNEPIVIDGVKETLEHLSQKYKMAIVTTARRVDFELIHKELGIKEYMDFVLCEEDYPKAKPHPDPYLKALEIFKAKKEEAIVVEDSARGLQSAYNAGIECITVYNDFSKSQDFQKAYYKIDRFKNLLDIL